MVDYVNNLNGTMNSNMNGNMNIDNNDFSLNKSKIFSSIILNSLFI